MNRVLMQKFRRDQSITQTNTQTRACRVAALITASGATLVLLSAGGCTANQAQDVQIYRDVLTLDSSVDYSPGEPLTLFKAVLLTNQTNETLAIEGENYLQAIIDRKRSVASFLPTLDLLPTYRFQDATTSPIPGLSESEQFDTTLSGNITLFDGFRNANRLNASDMTIEQRRWLLLDLRESLLLDVARVYYRVLRDEQRVLVLENAVTVQEERVRDIRARQRIGVVRPLDASQTEAQLSQTRVGLLNAQNAVRTGRIALSFLTGTDLANSPLSDGFDLPESPPTLDELLSIAQANRQDLAAASAQAQAARHNVDVAIGKYAPSVSLNLDYFLTRDTFPSESDWLGMLRVNIPIFSAGRIEADVRQAWSQFRQSVLGYSLLRRQIQQDVELAYQDVRTSIARMTELKVQLKAAQESLRQAEASYQEGLGTNLERISAQDQLLNSQLLLASEVYDQKTFYLTAYRAIGSITEGTLGLTLPPQPMPRAVLESPFVYLPSK